MKNKELIEALQKQDPEMEVMCEPESCGCLGDFPVDIVEVGDTPAYDDGGPRWRKVILLKMKEYGI